MLLVEHVLQGNVQRTMNEIRFIDESIVKLDGLNEVMLVYWGTDWLNFGAINPPKVNCIELLVKVPYTFIMFVDTCVHNPLTTP